MEVTKKLRWEEEEGLRIEQDRTCEINEDWKETHHSKKFFTTEFGSDPGTNLRSVKGPESVRSGGVRTGLTGPCPWSVDPCVEPRES